MFVDRIPTRPNRYKVTPDNGEPYYVTLERADEPIVEGTALSASAFNNLLPKPTVAAVGQYLRITSVDANGKILAVEAVNLNEVANATI